MSNCRDLWRLNFKSSSGMDLDFDSKVQPVIGNGFDYASATNKPSINGVTLEGNKSNEDLQIGALTNADLEELLKN